MRCALLLVVIVVVPLFAVVVLTTTPPFPFLAQNVSANSSMLANLLQGEHDCPRWVVVVPKKPPSGVISRTRELMKPKNWLNKYVPLHLMCPISRCCVLITTPPPPPPTSLFWQVGHALFHVPHLDVLRRRGL